VLAGTVAIAATYAILFLGQGAVDTLMGEDGAIEYIGAAALLATGVLFFVAFLRVRRAPVGVVLKMSLVVLALVFVFGAGEEISWGQRIFGVETPSELRDANAQEEITFHNLNALEDLIEIERLFQLFWAVFAVVVPVACAISRRLRAWLERLIPIFPLWLAALFVIGQVIAELVEIFLDANPALYHASLPLTTNRFEMSESVVAVLFAIGAYVILREMTAARSPAPDRTTARPATGSAPR
jgi:hypothetical protein